MFEIFVSEYSRHFEDCFPLKTIKHNNPKKIKISMDITKGLLASVRKKKRLYNKLLKHPTLIAYVKLNIKPIKTN
jgi:hypothetical protein